MKATIYRTYYPFRWAQQRYEYFSIVNVFGRMRKMKGPSLREMSTDEESRILNGQDSHGGV